MAVKATKIVINSDVKRSIVKRFTDLDFSEESISLIQNILYSSSKDEEVTEEELIRILESILADLER